VRTSVAFSLVALLLLSGRPAHSTDPPGLDTQLPFALISPLSDSFVFFRKNSDELDKDALETLGRQFLQLRGVDFHELELIGYFDESEAADIQTGLDLARRRALAVLRVYEGFGLSNVSIKVETRTAHVIATGDKISAKRLNRTVRVNLPEFGR
jgi:outer membrane protein OmpA-like peptidoglycan-associated protein